MIKYNNKEITPKLNGNSLSKVMYNGKKIYPTKVNNIILVNKADSIAGDVCIADSNSDLLFCRFVDSGATHKLSDYTPIGLTVVPASHGHYADGKCAIMSLNHMNCDAPTTEGSSQAMRWGASTDIDTLPNLNKIPYVGSNGSVGDTIIGVTGTAYLPSDYSGFTAVTNPYDPETKYYSSSTSYKYIPSPYNNDGTFNPNYSLTDSPSSTSNCLADFDGKGNTQKILEVRGSKDYSSWTPSRTTPEDYPAVSCCDMYSTVGIPQGNWYLPSTGELGYIVPRRQALDNSLNKLIQGGVSSANVFTSSNYWSSSECSSTIARGVYLSNGGVALIIKNSSSLVRAFALV